MEGWVADEGQGPLKSSYGTMEKIKVKYLSHITNFVDYVDLKKIDFFLFVKV